MDLKTYLSTSERGTAKQLAAAMGISTSYLSQLAHGVKGQEVRISIQRCVVIEDLTGGAVRCEELRPDVDWDKFKKVLCKKGRK